MKHLVKTSFNIAVIFLKDLKTFKTKIINSGFLKLYFFLKFFMDAITNVHIFYISNIFSDPQSDSESSASGAPPGDENRRKQTERRPNTDKIKGMNVWAPQNL
jgi:hypothetical protein